MAEYDRTGPLTFLLQRGAHTAQPWSTTPPQKHYQGALFIRFPPSIVVELNEDVLNELIGLPTLRVTRVFVNRAKAKVTTTH